jgi:hypothetical protein
MENRGAQNQLKIGLLSSVAVDCPPTAKPPYGDELNMAVSGTYSHPAKGALPILVYCEPGTFPATCPVSGTYKFIPNDAAPPIAEAPERIDD